MFIMNETLAKKAIVEAKIRIPMMARLKDNKHIDLYFLYFDNKEFIIAEIDWDNDNNEKYYLVDKDDIGDTILPDEEWNQNLEKGIKEIKEIIKILKDFEK